MSTPTNEHASATACSLHLQVRYLGDSLEEGGGFRRNYRYRIDDNESPDGPVIGADLYSGVGAPIDARAALATLVSFVSAAGEAYGHTMRGGQAENRHLFRRGVAEAAYLNSDELQILAMDLEQVTTRSGEATRRSTALPDPPAL